LNKAPDAFRTISEVADELDLPQHVLRFWESRFPHIRPMKRGGGRRYYRPEDVDLLRGIRHLLYGDGYTIRGVQRILREQGVRAVQAIGQGHTVALPERSADDGEADEPDVPPPHGNGSTEPATSIPPLLSSRPPAQAQTPAEDAAATLPPAPEPAVPERLAPEALGRLKAALADLEACRRLLDETDDAGP
jgi:DNA-binding transcriptional MerR regulator